MKGFVIFITAQAPLYCILGRGSFFQGCYSCAHLWFWNRSPGSLPTPNPDLNFRKTGSNAPYTLAEGELKSAHIYSNYSDSAIRPLRSFCAPWASRHAKPELHFHPRCSWRLAWIWVAQKLHSLHGSQKLKWTFPSQAAKQDVGSRVRVSMICLCIDLLCSSPSPRVSSSASLLLLCTSTLLVHVAPGTWF